jgi:hypothetical protein
MDHEGEKGGVQEDRKLTCTIVDFLETDGEVERR